MADTEQNKESSAPESEQEKGESEQAEKPNAQTDIDLGANEGSSPGSEGTPEVSVVSGEQERPQTARPAPKKMKPTEAETYFANDDKRIERALEKVKKECVLENLDGAFIKLFVLAEVDHWNHDRERVVLVCENSVLSINYSFITEKWTELTRVTLKCTSDVHFAHIQFPKRTLQWPRAHKCAKLVYQRLAGAATTSEMWNPFSRHLPWLILTSHPLADKIEGETKIYNIEEFYLSLMEAFENYRKRNMDAPHFPAVSELPIEINVRMGLSSFLINQSHLAFAKDRGGVHF